MTGAELTVVGQPSRTEDDTSTVVDSEKSTSRLDFDVSRDSKISSDFSLDSSKISGVSSPLNRTLDDSRDSNRTLDDSCKTLNDSRLSSDRPRNYPIAENIMDVSKKNIMDVSKTEDGSESYKPSPSLTTSSRSHHRVRKRSAYLYGTAGNLAEVRGASLPHVPSMESLISPDNDKCLAENRFQILDAKRYFPEFRLVDFRVMHMHIIRTPDNSRLELGLAPAFSL